MLRTITAALLFIGWLGFGTQSRAAVFDPADGDFFTSAIQASIDEQVARIKTFKDKNNPVVFDLPEGLGKVYAFQHAGTPILAVKGVKPLALDDNIGLPFEAIRLETWLYIYSTKALTLKKVDFPTAITTQLDGLWKWDRLALLKGHTAIAVPGGDILATFQDLLMLNDVSGTEVLALRSGADAKKVKTSLAEILIKGTLNKPFAIDMVLKDPTFTYKKVKIEQNWIKKYGVTGIATSGKTDYDFFVYDVVHKVPEIFSLQTDKLTPQNLLELNQAFSARLYNSTTPIKCDWSFANIPSIEIVPRKSGEKVRIFAAVPGAKNEEMGLVGPGLAVSGKLRVPPLSAVIKEVADFSLVLNQKQCDADFKVADLVLPGTNIPLSQAKGSFHGNAFQLSARTPIPCLEEMAFEISKDGRFLPKKGFATPSALLSHVKGCVPATYGAVVAAAGQALQLGRQAYGFAADPLLSGVESVFGEQYVAAAGQAAGYTAGQVVSWAKATGKSAEKLGQLVKGVFPAQQVLGAVDKVYGAAGLNAVIKGAGYPAQDVMSWARDNGKTAAQIGQMVAGLFPAESILGVADKLFEMKIKLPVVGTVKMSEPTQMGELIKGASIHGDEVVKWAKQSGKSTLHLGLMIKGVFSSGELGRPLEKYYGAVKLAEVGKAAGWTAQELSSTYAGLKGVKLHLPSSFPIKDLYVPYTPEFVARTLNDAGFPEGEVKSALKSVFKISESAANDAWKGAVNGGKAVGNAAEDGYNYIKNLF